MQDKFKTSQVNGDKVVDDNKKEIVNMKTIDEDLTMTMGKTNLRESGLAESPQSLTRELPDKSNRVSPLPPEKKKDNTNGESSKTLKVPSSPESVDGSKSAIKTISPRQSVKQSMLNLKRKVRKIYKWLRVFCLLAGIEISLLTMMGFGVHKVSVTSFQVLFLVAVAFNSISTFVLIRVLDHLSRSIKSDGGRSVSMSVNKSSTVKK